jgi:alkyldihydroxyacetonephosphate synthase
MRRFDRWNGRTAAHLAGEEALSAWLERQLGLPAPVAPTPTSAAKFRLPPNRLADAVVVELERWLRPDQVARDGEKRVRAAFGGHFFDAIARRDGLAEHAPDAVVFPETAEQLERVFLVADRFDLRLRLRGAGTAAEETQRGDDLDRPALAVDLTRFANLLHWDRRAGFVDVEGGARYVDVESALAAHRFELAPADRAFPWAPSSVATVGAAFACGVEPRAIEVTMTSPSGSFRYRSHGSPAERAAFLLLQGARGEAGVVARVRLPIVATPRAEARLRFLFPGWDGAIAGLRALDESGIPAASEAFGPETLARRLAMAGLALPARLSKSRWLAAMVGGFWRRSPYRTPALLTVALRGNEATVRGAASAVRRLLRSGGALEVPESAIPPMLEGIEPERVRSSLFAFRCLSETFATDASWVEAGAVVERASRAIHARFERDGVRGWIGWTARAGLRGVALRATVVAPQLVGAEIAQYAGYRIAFERSVGDRRALPLNDGPALPVGKLERALVESADPHGRLRRVGVVGGSRWRKLATEETRYCLEDAGELRRDEAALWAPESPVPPPFPERPTPRNV